jgi:hypothetical protein
VPEDNAYKDLLCLSIGQEELGGFPFPFPIEWRLHNGWDRNQFWMIMYLIFQKTRPLHEVADVAGGRLLVP